MSILGRFVDIIRSNVNDLLDRAEDPLKIAKLELEKRLDMLAECKNDTAEVMAAEKRAERELEAAEKESAKFAEIAKKALMRSKEVSSDAERAECEQDAAKAIEQKQRYDAKLDGLHQALDAARDSSAKMRELTLKLTNDIDTLRGRLANIEHSVKIASAQESVNKMDKYSSVGLDDKFDRMERKAIERLDKANAAAELAGMSSSAADLEHKYGSTGKMSVDDELARMKKDLGM